MPPLLGMAYRLLSSLSTRHRPQPQRSGEGKQPAQGEQDQKQSPRKGKSLPARPSSPLSPQAVSHEGNQPAQAGEREHHSHQGKEHDVRLPA